MAEWTERGKEDRQTAPAVAVTKVRSRARVYGSILDEYEGFEGLELLWRPIKG